MPITTLIQKESSSIYKNLIEANHIYGDPNEVDAFVIRNNGVSSSNRAIRSLIISCRLQNIHEWFVIHHIDCGLELSVSDIIRSLQFNKVEIATIDESGWSSQGEMSILSEDKNTFFQTFHDLAASVTEDVQRIRKHPLVPAGIPVYGYVYDVSSGKLTEIPETRLAEVIQ